MERAVIFADGGVLSRTDLPPLGTLAAGRGVLAATDEQSVRIPKGLSLQEAEKEYIRQILAQCDGDVQRTAEILGISRKNLWEIR